MATPQTKKEYEKANLASLLYVKSFFFLIGGDVTLLLPFYHILFLSQATVF